MLGLLTGFVSPAGPRARLSAFIFHRVPALPDPLLPDEPDARAFDDLLTWITRQFNVLEPRSACERLLGQCLPERAAIITFDDGYRDNAQVALPILQRHGVSAAFFIATGFLDGGTMFNDRVIEAVRGARAQSVASGIEGIGTLDLSSLVARRAAIGRLLAAVKYLPPAARDAAVSRLEDRLGAAPHAALMMSSGQVRALHDAGMAVGGHTRSHPILAGLTPQQARAEIVDGRNDLADILGEMPALFAYPNGRRGRDWGPMHPEMVRDAGFAFAFTTEPGAADASAAPLALPRFTPWGRNRLVFGWRALQALRTPQG